jgi:hypothetical protein
VHDGPREWTLFAPADQPGAVRFPDIPVELHFGDSLGATVRIMFSSKFAGYDQARLRPLEFLHELTSVPHPVPDGFTFRSAQL